MIALSPDLAQRAGNLLLRWTVAGLMLFHGVAKLLNGIDGISAVVMSLGMPAWIAYGVLIGEVIAPLMVIVGLFVGPAALVMAFNMVVAVGLAHAQQLFSLGESGGYALELQAFYFFGSLAIALLAYRRPGA